MFLILINNKRTLFASWCFVEYSCLVETHDSISGCSLGRRTELLLDEETRTRDSLNSTGGSRSIRMN
ncbi:hypothetical protein RchiOBHm_Chr1g0359931 [Rosa chinensis]|uniref:Uncharacterized protein n=1 Tax=Rosa chinensis TaxID=74649 RepID=A0A2P6SIH8_ROSCH|nr:hypothetical protein RchiOBHm_Chr1g0359931 [Rosa chinensis]